MKKFTFTFLIVTLILILSFACKTAESFVWDPVGNWDFVILAPWGTWTEHVILSGSESGGTLSGWTQFNPGGTPGIWTKTGDWSISVQLNYWNYSYNEIVELTGTSSESSPNNVIGSGTWTENASDHSITFTATKTSNLQL